MYKKQFKRKKKILYLISSFITMCCMNSVLNTQNSKTRDHALHTIIDNMNKTSSYVPFAYNLDGSNCSCCLSEYFYLVMYNYTINFYCYISILFIIF